MVTASLPAHGPRDFVTVVINCFDDLRFLPDAIASALTQTVPAADVVVVDDGSRDDPAPIVARYPGVRLIRQRNAGLAAARNTGLAAATTPYIAFLDADDRLLPDALGSGLDCFAATPEAGLVYGAHRKTDAGGSVISGDIFHPIRGTAYEEMLRGNCIGMHATVLHRAATLRRFGGFDERLRLCEDYDLYLRIAEHFEFGSHRQVVAEYRRHDRNVSNRFASMREAALSVHRRHRPAEGTPLYAAWCAGRDGWIGYYRDEMQRTRSRPRKALSSLKRRAMTLPGSTGNALLGGLVRLASALRSRRTHWPPRIGGVDLGDLATTRPVSLDFGFDRGLPIDRHYIESFLERHRDDLRGAALEVGDDSYCRRFGGERIARQDILHVHAGNPLATMVGELSDATVVPDGRFDCIVLTQTLHLIFDFQRAVERLHAALKPGGVLLLTVPGITPVDRGEWHATWYWSFTEASIRRLFGAVFGEAAVTVVSHGNVYAAVTYLHGLASAEVDRSKLAVHDAAYPVIVAVRARKAD